MFAQDTKLFSKRKNIKTLFKSNSRALKYFRMVSRKQISLNEDKARFTLFRKLQDRDYLLLQLPVRSKDGVL